MIPLFRCSGPHPIRGPSDAFGGMCGGRCIIVWVEGLRYVVTFRGVHWLFFFVFFRKGVFLSCFTLKILVFMFLIVFCKVVVLRSVPCLVTGGHGRPRTSTVRITN